MNIRPDLSALVEDVRLLKQQVATIFDMIAGTKTVRDPSIGGFCKRRGFSRGTYMNLRAAGKGPRETAVGSRRTIDERAERDWVEAREREAAAIAKERKAKREAK